MGLFHLTRNRLKKKGKLCPFFFRFHSSGLKSFYFSRFLIKLENNMPSQSYHDHEKQPVSGFSNP